MSVKLYSNFLYCYFIVIKAVVISDKQETVMTTTKVFPTGIPAPVFVHYNLHVTNIFKGKEKIQNVTSVTSENNFIISVHTSQAGAQCGMHLVKGKKYLISGRIFNTQFQINHCDWVQEFSELSKLMKHGIHGRYGCKCQVGTCIDGDCNITDGCKWRLAWNHPGDKCTENYRMCEHVNSKCQWSNENDDYQDCKLLKGTP